MQNENIINAYYAINFPENILNFVILCKIVYDTLFLIYESVMLDVIKFKINLV